MANKFTTEQQAVIDARISNLLCSAAAGSGKTSVLVERIVVLTTGIGENPPKELIDIDRLLVVTFTKNAAATMKERLYKKFTELSKQYPDNRRILNQMTKVMYADILTLDAFCSKVVKNYCYASSIEPGFKIGDSAEIKILRKDVINKVIDRYHENGDEEFLDFMFRYSSPKNDDDIVKLIDNILVKSESALDEEAFIESIADNYNYNCKEEFLASNVCKQFVSYINDKLESISIKIDNLVGMCRRKNESKLADMLVVDGDVITSIKSTDFEQLCNGLAGAKFKNKDAKAAIDSEFGDTIWKARDEYKGSKGTISALKKLMEDFSIESILANNAELYPLAKTLSRICLDARHEIVNKKHSDRIYDFSDIAHEAYKIIRDNETIRDELIDSYNQIMIDEYQDSNYIQEALMKLISREKYSEPNIFMVGDVKQSIYKFRMAKPQLIAGKQETYVDDYNADNRIIKLNKNFRSSNKVVELVNDVFNPLMQKGTVGYSYNGQELVYGAIDYNDYNTKDEAVNELILLNASDMSDDNKSEAMCSLIAEQIINIVNNEQVLEDKVYRKASYKDIAILARTNKGLFNDLCTYLPDHGIPAMASTSTGYFNTTEILYIINYLTIIDNPYNDIALAAVLKGYPQCFTDDELVKLKLFKNNHTDNEKKYLFSVCEEYDVEDSCKDKLDLFFKDYNYLKDLSKIFTVSELVKELYNVTGFYSYAIMMPAGKLRCANLDMLYVKAKNFENNNSPDINSFIKYIETLKKYEIEEGEATVGDGVDFVNMMTIHSSKGMEFPYVIIVDMSRNFNKMDARASFVFDDEHGFGFKYVDSEHLIKLNTIQRKVVSDAIDKDNIAEEIRIFYVALTRAKQRLIMLADYKDDYITKKGIEGAGERLSAADILDSSNYIDLIAPIFFDPEIAKEFIDLDQVMIGDYLKITNKNKAANLEIASDVIGVSEEEQDYSEIKKYFDFNYYDNHSNEKVPVKYSVSELKHEAIEEYESMHPSLFPPVDRASEDVIVLPSFIEDKEKPENYGAKKGTYTHTFMEKVVVTDLVEVDELIEFTNKMKSDGIFPEDMLKYIELGKISNFLKSDTCKDMREAYKNGLLFLEQPFVYGIPANTIRSHDYKSSELVLVQGIIDAYYVKDNEFIILDYKTDKVDSVTGEDKLKGYYTEQLKLYGQAVEKITGLKQNSLLIYSFALERLIRL